MFLRKYRLQMTENDTSGGLGGGGQATLPDLSGGDGGSQGGLLPAQTNPWDSVPKSWAQEHHPHWEKVSPEVRQVIHKRESDVEKGIRSYYDGHQRWNKLSTVFQDVAQPDTDLVGVYETLANNHKLLMQSEPSQRRELFKEMAKHYGVDLADVQAAARDVQQGQGGPDITKTVQEHVTKAMQPFMAERQAQQFESYKKTVDAFFSDPKNEFAKDVAADMLKLIQSGQRDLPLAYEMAILRNPEVKAKYLAKLAQSGAGGQEGANGDNVNASANRNVKSSGEGAPSGKPKTMDDTMNAIVRKHYGTK